MPIALLRCAVAGLAVVAIALWAALAIWLHQPLLAGPRMSPTPPLTAPAQPVVLPLLPAETGVLPPPQDEPVVLPPPPAQPTLPRAGAGSHPAPFPPATGLGVRHVADMDAALAYTEQALQQYWGKYSPTHFSWVNEQGGTPTGCGTLNRAQGMAEAAFYCYRDKVIYLDITFLRKVDATYGINGVQAVVAHEYGHHIENMTHDQGRTSRQDELKADYYAGQFMAWLSQADPAMNEPALEREFAAIGDASITPGDASGAHGVGADRARSFVGGWRHEPFGSAIGQLSPSTSATA